MKCWFPICQNGAIDADQYFYVRVYLLKDTNLWIERSASSSEFINRWIETRIIQWLSNRNVDQKKKRPTSNERRYYILLTKTSYIDINRLHHAKSERISGFFSSKGCLNSFNVFQMFSTSFFLFFWLAIQSQQTSKRKCNSWPKFRQFVDLLFSVCVYRKPFELPMQNIYALLKR